MKKMPPIEINRRKLLIGGGVGAGLLIGWAVWPRRYRPNMAAAKGEHLFGPWLKIAEDGKIIVAIPQSEMGQGVFTQLAQIIAGELGADWRTVAVQPVMPNPAFANTMLAQEWVPSFMFESLDAKIIAPDSLVNSYATRSSFVVTAGSSSVRQFEGACRQAGAVARVLLCQAAAARWNTNWESCDTEGGFVAYNKKRLSFAQLVVDASGLTPPDPVPLRASPANNLSGFDVPRLDAAAKVDGSANFAGDVRLPDMLYASTRAGPIGESRLKSIDQKALKALKGKVTVVTTDTFVAALASNWWAANKALDHLAPVFETRGELADTAIITDTLESRFANGKGWVLHNTGSVAGTMEKAAGTRVYKAVYSVAPAVHAPLETRSATAHYTDGRLLLWLASQSPQVAIDAAAKAIGISSDDVTLFPMMAGGSFGRNMDNDIAAQVAVLAKQTQRPVQLIWSRPEDFMRDYPRAPAVAKMAASLDGAGRIQGMEIRIATPASARELINRLKGDSAVDANHNVRDKSDALALEGALPPYAIPNLSIAHFPASLPIQTGRYRGNADSYTCFFTEAFINELAAKSGVEPLSYRMQMLVGQTRLARCLTGVAALAGWDGGAAASGKGIACHSMRGSHIALIVSARTAEDGVRVDRISAVVDCGRIINPDIARQQIEGGIIFGLAQALGASTDYEAGLPLARRLRDIDLPKLADVPEIEIEFIRSDAEPGGLGEIGVPVVAPALAGALFSASGVRLREMPLLSKGL
jgi:isoquinoline 1-oxidoreductase subunit beta